MRDKTAFLTSPATKLATLLLGTGLLFRWIVPRVGSPAEAFWLILPLSVLIGHFGLQLFPAPRLGAKSAFERWASIFVLIAFPCGYYGFLVWATKSAWSWKECFLALYFFGVSFEIALMYLFQAIETLHARLSRGLSPGRARVLFVCERLVLYAVLVPFLLVVFAVHRPKLMPTAIAFAPAQAVEFLSRDGRTALHGIFLKPANVRGTVLVCHGVGANHADLSAIHELLFQLGFQVLAFDFRGHGLSAGHTITYGALERQDVLGAYDYCLSRSEMANHPLYALGASMGGAILVQALPEMPQVQAVVLDSAFSDLPLMVEHQFRYLPSCSRGALTQVVRGFAWLETGADIARITPTTTIREVSIPILVIHGTADRIVPPAHAQNLAAAGQNVHLHLEPNCPHISMIAANPEGYARLLRSHLVPTSRVLF